MTTRSSVVLFSYGFRPFFILAGLYAIVPVGGVYWALKTGEWPESALSVFAWHGHEMLFGFVSAAIAGFLLTAVAAWTNTKAVSGFPLICLVLIWMTGRAASLPWMPMPGIVVQILRVAFFPALALAVAVPLVRTRNLRNLPFIVLLTVFFVADLAFQARQHGSIMGDSVDGLRLAINVVMLMIVIVGGRIIPAFTRNALVSIRRDARIRARRVIDVASIVAAVSVLAGDLYAADSSTAGYLAALCAGLLFVRLSGWSGIRTLDIPLLWVLHLGYFWLVVALALKAIWILSGVGWAMNWIHAFTAGAFGTMILGVMTRVALGHTGRQLHVSVAIPIAYGLVSAAALIRTFGPWITQTHYLDVLGVSATLWVSAFAIFLVVYTPILISPRVDGRPG